MSLLRVFVLGKSGNRLLLHEEDESVGDACQGALTECVPVLEQTIDVRSLGKQGREVRLLLAFLCRLRMRMLERVTLQDIALNFLLCPAP